MTEQQPPKSIFKSAPVPKHKITKEEKLAKYNSCLAGEGQFVFENNTKGDLYLPRPTKYGRKSVGKGQQFLGDDYYFRMVPTELKFIRKVEDKDMPEKLITEQPPIVTHAGSVKHTVPADEEINEQSALQKDVLLTEQPLEGLKIIK